MSIYGKPDMLDALESGALRIAPNPEVEMFSTSDRFTKPLLPSTPTSAAPSAWK